MPGSKQPVELSAAVNANLGLGGPAIGNRKKAYLLPGQL